MNYYEIEGYLSNSELNLFHEKLTGRKKVNVTLERQTEIFAEGNLLDYMITEPERINYENKAFINDDGVSLTLFTSEVFDKTQRMRDAFFSDSFCTALLKKSIPQKEFYRTIEVNFQGYKFKQRFKGKLDLFNNPYSIDIKSTVAGNQNAFIQAIILFIYYQQAAIYTDLSKSEGLFFIGVQKNCKKYEKPKVYKYLIDKANKDGKGLYEMGRKRYSELAFYHKLLIQNGLPTINKG